MEADSTLNNVVFRDTLSTGMSFISGSVLTDAGISCVPTCSSVEFTLSGQELLIPFDTLANGAFVPQQITVEVMVLIDDEPSIIQ